MRRVGPRALLLAATAGIALLACAEVSAAPRTPAKAQRTGENPSVMIDRANQFVMQGRWEEAIPILERLTAQYPQIAAANEMLADCYLKASRPQDAAALLERCVEIEPGNVAYIQELGHAYIDLGQKDKAVASWRRLLTVDERAGSLYGVVAKMEQEAGLYDEAIEILREGARFKENADYYEREVIRLERVVGREEDAFTDALRLVGRRQGALESELRLVTEIFRESKRQERLIGVVDSAAAAGDKSGALHALKTIILVEGERYDDARKHLFGKGAPTPREEEIYLLLIHMGRMADRQGDARFEALNGDLMRYFTERFGPSPYTPGVMLMIASAKREAADAAGPGREARPVREKLLTEALALADEARRHKLGAPSFERACIFRARVLFEDLHRGDEALKELAVLGPRNVSQRGDVEELRARILLASGDWNQAAAGLKRIASDADTAIAPIGRYGLGRLAFLAGRFDEAVKVLSDLAEKSPSNAWANDALELALDVKGGLKEGGGALALYRAALLAQSRGEDTAAIDTLAAIEKRFPESSLAPRALFTKAGIEEEASNGPGAAGGPGAVGIPGARADYARLAEAYPLHDLAPRALEKLAALDERGNPGEALAQYTRLMERYPDYPFMERVRERYIALGKSVGAEAPKKGSK